MTNLNNKECRNVGKGILAGEEHWPRKNAKNTKTWILFVSFAFFLRQLRLALSRVGMHAPVAQEQTEQDDQNGAHERQGLEPSAPQTSRRKPFHLHDENADDDQHSGQAGAERQQE